MGRKSRAKQERPAATATAPLEKQPAPSIAARPWSLPDLVIVVLIVVLTIAVFAQVASHSFLAYDDGQFIFENEAVKKGLSGDSIRWAFTSTSIGWYPATWISHMIDVELWGLRPAGHLLTNVLFHTLNAILLFVALRLLTGSRWRSAMVAMLFAIHPMHVESVAWASERKDTLSTFFALLAILAYGSRIRRRMLLVAVCMALSLMAKQMYVTLPFVLLLLDVWPLRRTERESWSSLLIEKVPLFLLTTVAVIAAFIGQRNLGALQAAAEVPLGMRVMNAIVSYVRYIGKLFWPADLAVIYPMTPIDTATLIASLVLLLAVTAALFFYRRSAPYLLIGWLLFLGTLVPVIGIVQIGGQALADRYSYFAYIGLFIAICWGAVAAVGAQHRSILAVAGALVVLALAFLAWQQTRLWRDTETLFTHTIAVTPPNALAEYTLGSTFQMTNPDRAMPHLTRSVTILDETTRGAPAAWYAQPHIGIGTALIMKARATTNAVARKELLDTAITAFSEALKIDPNATNAKFNLQLAETMKAEIRPPLDPAAQLDTLLDTATLLTQQGRQNEAIAKFREAVAFAPESAEARVYLALGLAQARQNAEAITELRNAQRIDAPRANDILTKALRQPASPSNLSRLIEQLSQ